MHYTLAYIDSWLKQDASLAVSTRPMRNNIALFARSRQVVNALAIFLAEV